VLAIPRFEKNMVEVPSDFAYTFQIRGSNPVRCLCGSGKIYGFFKKIRASKSPETLDPVGFAPTGSKPFARDGKQETPGSTGI